MGTGTLDSRTHHAMATVRMLRMDQTRTYSEIGAHVRTHFSGTWSETDDHKNGESLCWEAGCGEPFPEEVVDTKSPARSMRCPCCVEIITEVSDNTDLCFVNNWWAGKCSCPTRYRYYETKTGKQVHPNALWTAMEDQLERVLNMEVSDPLPLGREDLQRVIQDIFRDFPGLRSDEEVSGSDLVEYMTWVGEQLETRNFPFDGPF